MIKRLFTHTHNLTRGQFLDKKALIVKNTFMKMMLTTSLPYKRPIFFCTRSELMSRTCIVCMASSPFLLTLTLHDLLGPLSSHVMSTCILLVHFAKTGECVCVLCLSRSAVVIGKMKKATKQIWALIGWVGWVITSERE